MYSEAMGFMLPDDLPAVVGKIIYGKREKQDKGMDGKKRKNWKPAKLSALRSYSRSEFYVGQLSIYRY